MPFAMTAGVLGYRVSHMMYTRNQTKQLERLKRLDEIAVRLEVYKSLPEKEAQPLLAALQAELELVNEGEPKRAIPAPVEAARRLIEGAGE